MKPAAVHNRAWLGSQSGSPAHTVALYWNRLFDRLIIVGNLNWKRLVDTAFIDQHDQIKLAGFTYIYECQNNRYHYCIMLRIVPLYCVMVNFIIRFSTLFLILWHPRSSSILVLVYLTKLCIFEAFHYSSRYSKIINLAVSSGSWFNYIVSDNSI